MMLMLAQSNPQLFALIGTKASINKELERVEQFSKLQQLTADDLLIRNKRHWKEWLEKYRKLFKYAPVHCKRVGFAGLGKMTKTKSLPFKRLFQNYYKHTGNLCVG